MRRHRRRHCNGSKRPLSVIYYSDNALLLDGFTLNIGDPTQEFLVDALSYLFGHMATTSFKLYVGMDAYASGDASYKRINFL